MKNLKKVVALSLAAVMMFGMMVVGAGAASYKDTKDSDFGTAIEVVSAIKVISGNDGNFNPNGELVRADAAILLARVALGSEMASKLSGTVNAFSDVPANAYYAGYVAWAAKEGYIKGNNGAFDPMGKLQGVAFAKLLLNVLGYEDANEEIGTGSWSDTVFNITYLAAFAGLLNGMEDIDLTATMTREQAAQMAFNAIVYGKQVSYEPIYTFVNGALTTTFKRNEGTTELKTKYGVAFKTVDPTVNDMGYTCWTVNGEEVKATVSDPVANIVLTGNHNNAPAIDALGKGQLKGVLFAGTPASNGGTPDDPSDDIAADLIVPVINGKETGTVSNVPAEARTAIAALTGHGKTVKLYTAKNEAGKTVVYAVEVSYETLIEVQKVVYTKSTDTYTFKFVDVKGADTIADVTFNPAPNADNKLYNALVAMELEAEDRLVATTKWNNDAGKYVLTTVAEPTVVTGVITEVDATKNTLTVDGEVYTYNFDMLGNPNLVKSDITLGSDNTVLAVDAFMAPPAQPNTGYIYVTENWSVTSGRETGKHFFAGYTVNGDYLEEIETVDDSLTLNKLYAYEIDEDGVYDFGDAAETFETTDMEIANGKINSTFAAGTVTYLYIFTDGEGKLATVVNTELAEITDDYFIVTGDDKGTTVVTNVIVLGEYYEEPDYDFEDGIVYVAADVDVSEDATNTKLAANHTDEVPSYLYNVEVYIDGVKSNIWVDGDLTEGFFKYYLDTETGAYDLYAMGGATYFADEVVLSVDSDTVDDETVYFVTNAEFYKDWYVTGEDSTVYVATDADLYCLTADTAINTLADAVEFAIEGEQLTPTKSVVTLTFYGYTDADTGVNYVTAIYATYGAAA